MALSVSNAAQATPIRVALFFTTLGAGGTERQAMELLRHVDRKRFDVHVYALRGGVLQHELKALDIPVRIVQLEGRGPASNVTGALRSPRIVRRWLREDSIDILHALLWHTNLVSRFACHNTTVRCINSVRWAERKARDAIDALTRGRVDWWIANSLHGAHLARLPREKTSIIRNGLPDELLKTPLTAWRPAPHDARGMGFAKRVIMVGQFRREKQFDVLIKAAQLLPSWRFDLVGDGPRRAEMESLARRLGVRNVAFLGHRTDIKHLLLTHDVSVLLSASEGTPNVTLESLALGVPFVGSDIAAHHEALDAPKRGMLAKSEPEAVAEALLRLAAVPAKELYLMRAAGQEYVRATYPLMKMVKETQAVWGRVARMEHTEMPEAESRTQGSKRA